MNPVEFRVAGAATHTAMPPGMRDGALVARRSGAIVAKHALVLLIICVAGTEASPPRESEAGWFSWVQRTCGKIAVNARRAAVDWGVMAEEPPWKRDLQVCARKEVVDAFFDFADADASTTVSSEEWTKACADHRSEICLAWEKECIAQQSDAECLSQYADACIEAPAKTAERLAEEQNVFYLMGSRAVTSPPDVGGLLSGDGEVTLTEWQRPIIPYVSGIWQMTYEFNEMKGPRANLEKNPCFGPFPYRYTWNVYIWQKVESINGTRRTTGELRVCWYDWMDCQADSRHWFIVESNPTILQSKCAFSGYDEHPYDWFRFPGYPQGGYQEVML
jgi:hypothetical protein